MKRLIGSVLFTSLIFSNSPLSAKAFELEADGSAPLYQTHLDIAVYHHSASDNLGDLTIQNANGEQVPYALVADTALNPNSIRVEGQALKWFAITENVLLNTQKLQLAMSGTQVNIQHNLPSTTEKIMYLVDAGKDHPALQTLQVDWQGDAGQLIQVDVLASNDLKNWQPVGRGVLLNTHKDGQAILQNTLRMDNANNYQYYQLVPQLAANTPFKLKGVDAQYHRIKPMGSPMVWQALSLQTQTKNSQGQLMFDYEALGHYPATAMRVELPVRNTITQMTVFTRNHSHDPWQRITTASVYRTVKAGQETRNPDVLIPINEARYWRLQFHQAGGGIGQQTPSLSLGWVPHTVIWNARGPAPFTMQVGHQPKLTNRVMLHELVPENHQPTMRTLPKASVQVSDDYRSPTQSAWVTPPDYKRWLLWAGLLVGVLVLAGMAWSLLKSSKQNEPFNNAR